MTAQPRSIPLWRLQCVAPSRMLMLLAAAMLPLPVLALQPSAQFDVMIQLSTAVARPQTGLCDSTSATTIVCNSLGGRQLQAGAPAKSRFDLSGYRFISYVSGLAGSVDIYTNAGTSTAFRLVNWSDREYIEMTVGW